jgi:hypothetical protein
MLEKFQITISFPVEDMIAFSSVDSFMLNFAGVKFKLKIWYFAMSSGLIVSFLEFFFFLTELLCMPVRLRV